MSRPRATRRSLARHPLGLAVTVLAVATAAVVAVAVATGSDPGDGRLVPPAAPATPGTAPLATPLATSVRTASGTWATVAMGHLGQPLNTFWQLLEQPGGTGSWANHVEATAVATNGGMVLAATGSGPSGSSGGGGSGTGGSGTGGSGTGGSGSGGSGSGGLLVGVLPSQMLTYSPLVATADGSTWSTGVLDDGLAGHPASLATGPDGTTAALVIAHHTTAVMTGGGGLTSWRTATTAGALGATPAGRRCEVTAVTAVGFVGGALAVGASCHHPGVTGIFVDRDGRWVAGGPRAAADVRVEVLSLVPTPDGLAALLGSTGPGGTRLTAAWAAPDGGWTRSPALPLPPSAALASVGPASGSGLFVLFDSPGGDVRLQVVGGPGAGWSQLPSPPAGTATVAFDTAAVDALSVDDTRLTVWTMPPAGGTWTEAQTLHVTIPFTSSQ